MVLLLNSIFIILGIVIFALTGIFGVFPDNWEWVGIVLAGVGILMGVPSLLQMGLGRPKLILEFDRITKGIERHLVIYLKNQQLGDPKEILAGKKSIWRRFGVKRDTIESLTVSFRILEVGTGRILIPVMQARIFSDADPDEKGSWRTTLPPTMSFETTIMIASWDETKKTAIIPPDKIRSFAEFPSGIYQIHVIIAVDGEPFIYSRQFIVGNTADDLTWVKPTLGNEKPQKK